MRVDSSSPSGRDTGGLFLKFGRLEHILHFLYFSVQHTDGEYLIHSQVRHFANGSIDGSPNADAAPARDSRGGGCAMRFGVEATERVNRLL
jgi:hypothetical protein